MYFIHVKLYDKLCRPTSFWVPPCWCDVINLHISAKSHLEISAKDSKLEVQHQAELTTFLVGSWKFWLSELNWVFLLFVNLFKCRSCLQSTSNYCIFHNMYLFKCVSSIIQMLLMASIQYANLCKLNFNVYDCSCYKQSHSSPICHSSVLYVHSKKKQNQDKCMCQAEICIGLP